MTRIFAADSIRKTFQSHTVLSAASIWAHAGRITALLGRNGCGKSTLLKVSTGLIQADHGAIHFRGTVYERPQLAVLARSGLFYLPDRNLLSNRLTLRQQISGAEWHYGPNRTADILKRLELGNRLDQKVPQLSGGERRRAELAIAWICAPTCFLADEPFAGIDPADQEVIAAALYDMAQAGCAIIVSGHEVSRLMDIADDIVWMTAGTTHALGAPENALRHDQFRREYLGAPHR